LIETPDVAASAQALQERKADAAVFGARLGRRDR
jgi:hypothetical protein